MDRNKVRKQKRRGKRQRARAKQAQGERTKIAKAKVAESWAKWMEGYHRQRELLQLHTNVRRVLKETKKDER